MELPAIIFFAFVLDLLIGDPQYRWHPIRIIGRAVSYFAGGLKVLGYNGKGGGILLVLVITALSVAIYLFLHFVLSGLFPPSAMLFDLFTCYSCLAFKDLDRHIRPVVSALENDDLPKARNAVSMVVGRDVRFLDEAGVVRAAIETLAENFVDGFLSPLFWYVAAGMIAGFLGLSPLAAAVSFMVVFKVISTLDSMVGYKNEEFSEIGWAGARLDDLMNFIPARLCLIILWLGAAATGLDFARGLKVALRDRLKHDSPNSAHAESFAAGALGVRLGGPTIYADGLKKKPWLGEENPDPVIGHIRNVLVLLHVSAWISISVSVALALIA